MTEEDNDMEARVSKNGSHRGGWQHRGRRSQRKMPVVEEDDNMEAGAPGYSGIESEASEDNSRKGGCRSHKRTTVVVVEERRTVVI